MNQRKSSQASVQSTMPPTMSQVTLRSQDDTDRWRSIFQDFKGSEDRVQTLEVFGAERWQGSGSAWLDEAFLSWPILRHLTHLQLRNIDFRVIGNSLYEFVAKHRSSVQELTLENIAFENIADVFQLIGFESLVTLTILRVEWRNHSEDNDLHASVEDGQSSGGHRHGNLPPEDVSSVRCDLPALSTLHLRESSCDTSIAKVLLSMPSGLHLSSLIIHWSDESIDSLNDLLATCGKSLLEFGISNIFNAEFTQELSLAQNTNLTILYLNELYLFPQENLTPPLYQILSTLSSSELLGVFLNLTFEDGPNYESLIDNIQWEKIDIPLSQAPSSENLIDLNITVSLEQRAERVDQAGALGRIKAAIRQKLPRLDELRKVKFVGEPDYYDQRGTRHDVTADAGDFQ